MENYPRNGTDVDGAAITELFQEMGFLVEAHSNLSVYEMRKVFKQAAYKDYSGVSCLTCCILSHGQEGVIYGTDGTIEIREITSFFHGTNLSGKPKLFFFQACQGMTFSFFHLFSMIVFPLLSNGFRYPNCEIFSLSYFFINSIITFVPR